MPICARNITTLRFFNHAFIVSIIFHIAAKVEVKAIRTVWPATRRNYKVSSLRINYLNDNFYFIDHDKWYEIMSIS